MKILVVTSVFPNIKQPTLGIFVKERMFCVARDCELKVVAPVPWFPFVNYIKRDYRPRVPYLEIQEGIEVYHPRFFSIPKFFKSLDGIFFFFSSIITMLNIRKNFKFDIIDSHFVYPDGFGAVLLGKLFKKPVTVTVRGTLRRLLKSPLLKIQVSYALRKAVKIFSVCEDLRKVVIKAGIPVEKVSVVPNGVDIKKFKPREKMEARRELGLPLDKKIILSIGGLVPRKGFHKVIGVLPKIKEKIPDVIYVIVGGASAEGNNERELKNMVKKLNLQNEVIFAGTQPYGRLCTWLSASDIFCLATTNEGWANVFLEAMACGLPVVTTKVGGNEEVIVSEDYGSFFDGYDSNEMAKKIVTALIKNWDRGKIINYAASNTWDERVKQLINQLNTIKDSNDICLSEKVLIQ